MEEPYIHKIVVNDREIAEPVVLKKTGFLPEVEILEAKKSSLDKAVFAYPIKHYTNHEEGSGISATSIGTNGENFAVLEMDEFTVFIGDIFRIGEALIQVSQPGAVTMEQLQDGFKTGWYFRVLEEGEIQGGTDLELLERPHPEWSIAACVEVMYMNRDDLRAADELYSCDALGDVWKRALRKRLRGF